jgi:NADH-quinone oxidoreductase subunit L
MNTENILAYFIIVPFIGWALSLIPNRKQEKLITNISMLTIGLHALGALVFCIYWLMQGGQTITTHFFTVYQFKDFLFELVFSFTTANAVYLIASAFICFLVVRFSKFYLHRDPGFKRFFNTILFFYLGLNLIILAGNFETLFIGWEIMGITSFLLIGFYRDRYLPVKNAFKVLSIYRFGDVCLFMAMWLSHHTWHQHIVFSEINNNAHITESLQHPNASVLIILLLICIAAMVKSAMLPFSSWLPRAMEGPTTSSAIFYGSLSVHLGVLLLLKTYPLWQGVLAIKIIIAIVGIATAVVANNIAKVQSTVKTQIAYASITQIGIMFIEVALGLHIVAYIHFAGNVFLRTYQLLVSPSVLGYLVHDQFYSYKEKETKSRSKFSNTIFMLSLKEWNLDNFQFTYLWSPFKWIGRQLNFLNSKIFIFILGAFYAIGVVLFVTHSSININPNLFSFLNIAYAVIAVVLLLKAFAERTDAKRAWTMIVASQLFIAFSILLHGDQNVQQLIMFLSGTIVMGIIGYICLVKITTAENNVSLDKYHGHVYEHPKYALVFLIACLGIAGFPFTPTFLGLDILFFYIEPHQTVLAILAAISFVFIELTVLRIYARVFLGQHVKPYHEVAFRSS